MPNRTPEGKWVIFEKSTGKRFERWPVDALEMVKMGAYQHEDPASAATPAGTEPVKQEDPSKVLNLALASTADVTKGKPAEYAPGVPLVASSNATASAAKPLGEPVRTAGKAK